MQSQYITVNTTHRQVPLHLLSQNIKNFRGTDGAFPAFPYETIFLAEEPYSQPSHLLHSVSPLLNVPLELFLLLLRKKNRKEKK